MSIRWRSTLFVATVALGAQGAAANDRDHDRMRGCPAGQAIQSSNPSGNRVKCVPVVQPNALQAEAAARQAADAAEAAARQAADAAEAAARQAMDANILSIIGGLSEADIVGRWAMTGSTMCLQSSNGFNAFMSPQLPSAISQLHGTVSAVRTFRADGTGSSTGVTQSVSMPQLVSGPPLGLGSVGGASVADLDSSFTWSIDAEGRLVIDDDNLIPQNFLLPSTRVGWTVTIENVPSFVGHIGKDKRTIVMTHATMAVETSVLRDPSNTVIARTPRFCARDRVLTRLPD
jgi:hypothetical protein